MVCSMKALPAMSRSFSLLRLGWVAVAGVSLLVGCQEVRTTSADGSRPVAILLESSSAVPDTIRETTDSVRIVVCSGRDTLLDSVHSYAGESLRFGSVSAPNGDSLELEAIGYDRGVEVWIASARLPPSSGSQTAVLKMSEGKPTGKSAPVRGAVDMPRIHWHSSSAWRVDSTGLRWHDQPVRVFVTTTTPGVFLRYSLDGNAPTRVSPEYDPDSGILVDTTCHLQVAAWRDGWTPSPVLVREYRFQARGVSSRTVDGVPWLTTQQGATKVGFHDRPVVMTLFSPTPDPEIRYTLDGSNPDRSSPLYPDSGLRLDRSVEVRAVVFAGKAEPSPTVFRDWVGFMARPVTVVRVSDPEWSKGLHDRPVTVTLSTLTPNAEIRYTLDGSVPEVGSALYPPAGIVLDSAATLRASAFVGSIGPSAEVLSRAFQFQARPVTFSTAGAGMPPRKIGLSTLTPNATIHFTRDGSLPDATDSLYTDSIVFDGAADSLVLRAVSVPNWPGIVSSTPTSAVVYGVSPWNHSVTYGAFTDSRDGRAYRTVVIGGREWMAENLAYVTARSWCLHDDDRFCSVYGRLYSWSAAMGLGPEAEDSLVDPVGPVRGACPEGWQLPAREDWEYLDSVGGGHLAAASWAGWDRFGFRALPGGGRYAGGVEDSKGRIAYWWSRSEDARGAASFYRFEAWDDFVASYEKTFAISVRCIR